MVIAGPFVNKDEVLITVNTLELLGIIYLAIAISKLRERIAHLEGKASQRERDEDTASK